jgi:hypothetical protein
LARSAFLRVFLASAFVACAAGSAGCANSPTDPDTELDAGKRPDATGANDTGSGPADASGPDTTLSADGPSALDSGMTGMDSGIAADTSTEDVRDAAASDGEPPDGGGDGSVPDAADATGVQDSGASADSGHPDSGEPADSGQPGDSATAGDASDGSVTLDSGQDSGQPDSGQPDSSTCVVAVSSQGPFDGGACPAPVTGSCGPGSLAGFAPTWRPPTGAHQALCTGAMISQIYNDCFVMVDPTACIDDESNFASCFNCLFTDETAPSWGPLVDQASGISEINISGCIALLEPCNLACAQAYQYSYQCEVAACDSNCASSSINQYDNCTVTADDCSCQTYFDPAQCEANITGSHPAASCTTQTTFQAYYNVVAPLFCGQ